MEYFRHSLWIRILAVMLTVVIQMDLFDSISSLHPESESQQLEETIDRPDSGNDDEGDLDQSICHLRSQQKGRSQILHNNFQSELTQVMVSTFRSVFNTFITHFISGEYRSLLTLFCVYRI